VTRIAVASVLAVLTFAAVATRVPSRPSVSATPQAATSTPYSHVVWILMENHGYNQIVGGGAAPYINSLISQYGSATNFFAEGHPSLPNYTAMTSGSTQGITDDNNPSSHPLNVENIFHQLGGGQSQSLEESMPSNCYGSDFTDASGGKYSAHHNPMAYYTNLGTDCQNYDIPLSLAPSFTPKFTFVTPNQTDNMHTGTISQGDSFLQSFIPKITSTADYQAGKTVVFVTWDEDEGSENNHIPTITINPNGAHDTSACQGTQYTHYSMLRFVEDNFGLARIGNAASANSMSGCFGLSSGGSTDGTSTCPTTAASASDGCPPPMTTPVVTKPPAPTPKKHCIVPRLRGKRLRAATRALGRAHCRLGRVTKKRVRRPIRKRRVVAQSPAPGTVRRSGTRVSLVLSK
jgi:phosphatidylinositol-3-phosphatase